MPSLATTQPNYPRRLDLRDSVDPTDRQLESIFASVSLALGALQGIKNPSATADVQALKYHMPGTIPSASRGTYEGYVDTCVTDLNAVMAQLVLIQGLKPAPNNG